MDLATLKAFKPTEFEDAADGYRTTGEMATAAKDTIDSQICGAIRGRLKGDAADAALRALRELSKNFHYTQSECGLVSTALNGFAFDMAAAKRKLQAALEDARANGCTVDANGAVTYPAGGEEQDGKIPAGGTVTGAAGSSASPTAAALDRQAAAMHPNPNYGKASQYADRVADALGEAANADAKWAPKLRALKADDDLVVSNADWADTKSDSDGVLRAADAYLDRIASPPKDGTPEQNAEWWNSLTPEQRADYLAVHPGVLGALNGLPADIRDEGNRMVLAQTRATYQMELNGIPPEPAKRQDNHNDARGSMTISPEWKEWQRKYGKDHARLENAMNGMEQIQNRFDRTGEKGLPEAYLLGFDPTGLGDGKVIIANGNPDLADHVAVYVPGTHAGIESIGDGGDCGELGKAERLWSESSAMSPGQDVSTITWLDYNAPDSVPTEATQGKYADEGGPRLYDFLQGNRAAQENAVGIAAHNTAVGHSYGSTVVGVAAQSGSWKDSKVVDDFVFAGSPGVQANRAADLGVGADHVWAMGGPWDDQVVRQGGRVVGLGDIGTIPTDSWFGGNVMESDSGGHGGFWDEDSQSLRNQAAVITGKYQRVELD
ncbi:alpha/beta hydrolase [Streptomyces niveus]|uniref:alpha/beta hydrolase n=1 Tax=Streptomyces niveus TaxID=193462 RepID=UPI0036548B7C